MDIRAALKEAMGRLREARVPSHTLAAELLLMSVLDCERAWLYAHPEDPMDAVSLERYFEQVARRGAGVPTQYLTGRQEFWGLAFEVTPDVLIPRPETEHVVEVALERLGQEAPGGAEGGKLRIADVGTGSGCLAVALARELPDARVVATDVSAAALAVARRNAARHGVAARIDFLQCNLLDAFECSSVLPRSESGGTVRPCLGQEPPHSKEPPATGHESRLFHLIVSNPPYVGRGEGGVLPREVREHEPAEALFAGEEGFELYVPLIHQAEQRLAAGGILVVELGYNASNFVRPLLDRAAWTNVSLTNDLAGIPRVLAAQRT
jgi:release factor glutamine methyltransferase